MLVTGHLKVAVEKFPKTFELSVIVDHVCLARLTVKLIKVKA